MVHIDRLGPLLNSEHIYAGCTIYIYWNVSINYNYGCNLYYFINNI